MSRHHNTKHNRTRSRYYLKRVQDRYGTYREGVQKSPDLVAGKVSVQKRA